MDEANENCLVRIGQPFFLSNTVVLLMVVVTKKVYEVRQLR